MLDVLRINVRTIRVSDLTQQYYEKKTKNPDCNLYSDPPEMKANLIAACTSNQSSQLVYTSTGCKHSYLHP